MKKKLVAILKTNVVMTESSRATGEKLNSKKGSGDLLIDCFEDEEGERSIRYRITIPDVDLNNADIRDSIKILPIHIDLVDPWLAGMFEPHINSYSDMADIELAAKLSGQPSLTVFDYDEYLTNAKTKPSTP